MPLRSHIMGRAALLATPLIAMALVVMLLGVLLWLLHRNEIEEARIALIKDILWVEQNIHFHLTSDEEKLNRIGLELKGQEAGKLFKSRDEQVVLPKGFEHQVQALINTNPEFQRISLKNKEGDVVWQLPPLEGVNVTTNESQTAFTMARKLSRAVWSAPFVADNDNVVEVNVPVFIDQEFIGVVAGVFSINSVLNHHVPWWVAQKYKIEILDSTGVSLASKSLVTLDQPGQSHQVRLDPPGHGLVLQATHYIDGTNLIRNSLFTAIVGLSLLAVLSLLMLRRQAHARLSAEKELRREHAFRKAMEDSLTVGMRARDMTGRIIYVNSAFCKMVGFRAEDLLGCTPPMPYWSPDDLSSTYEMHLRVLAGRAPQEGFEIQFQRSNGELFWALIYEAPLIDADGTQTGWMASILDVTERRKAEELARLQQENLQRTGRLITMGEMASTLAHELNQPLSAIASYNTGCLNRLEQGNVDAAELHQVLSKVGAQAQRAGQIIRRVHDFVRKSEPQMQVCGLNRVLMDTVGFIEFDAKRHGVILEVRLASKEPEVIADRILIEQVIFNLARNGIEAMAAVSAEKRRLHIAIWQEDELAHVSVTDNGMGISSEAVKNLFQPFYTTKAEGMGMGLNICRSIVEFHHGRLWYEENPEGGSVFRFTLPLGV